MFLGRMNTAPVWSGWIRLRGMEHRANWIKKNESMVNSIEEMVNLATWLSILNRYIVRWWLIQVTRFVCMVRKSSHYFQLKEQRL